MADGQRHLPFNISETKYGTIHLATDIAITSKGHYCFLLPHPSSNMTTLKCSKKYTAILYRNKLSWSIFVQIIFYSCCMTTQPTLLLLHDYSCMCET